MKTEHAIQRAAAEATAKGQGGGGTKHLATLLHITSSAISQWGEDVPESRVWQLRVLRPAWFDNTDSMLAGPAAGVAQVAEGGTA